MTGDGRDLYCSETMVYDTVATQRPGKQPVAWAVFEEARMPSKMQMWGIMQSLTLAYWLVQEPEICTRTDELKPEFVPELLARRLAKRGAGIRTRVIRDSNQRVTSVEFDTIPSPRADPGDPSGHSFQLAILEIQATAEGLPTRIAFRNTTPDRTGASVVLSEYLFNGSLTEPSLADRFQDFSPNPNAIAAIADYRNGGQRADQYKIKPGMPLPFRDSPSYATTRAAVQQQARDANIKRRRGTIIGVLCALTLLPLVMFIRSTQTAKI